MAIHFRCSECGSNIQVHDERAGEWANCPSCWDPVRVPSVSFSESMPWGDSHPRSEADDLMEPMPRLVMQALKSGARQHSRYFIAGLLVFLGLMAVSCGGVVGAIRSFLGPEKHVAPDTATLKHHLKVPEMRELK
jgi:hypothetical protein